MNKRFWYWYNRLFFKHFFYLMYKICPEGGLKPLEFKNIWDKLVYWIDQHIIRYDSSHCCNCGKYIDTIKDNFLQIMEKESLTFYHGECPRCGQELNLFIKKTNKIMNNNNNDIVIGIKLDEKDLNLVTQQLEDISNKVKQLNTEFEKLQSNEVLKSMNNITINTAAFMGNEQDAEKFAKLLSKHISKN